MHPDPDTYLADCVKIEPTVIEEEYIRLPGDLAYWNAEYSRAYQHWLESKLEREVKCAHLTAAYRSSLEGGGTKSRVTIGEVDSLVQQDPDYVMVRTKEITSEADKVRLAGVMDALRCKKEMLISLGAHIRLEMGNDPMVRQQRGIAREVEQSRG